MVRRVLAARWVRNTVLLGLCAPSVMIVPTAWAAHAAAGRVTADVAAVPARPVALVLGAGLEPDGRPTQMLAERVDAAVALYRRGMVGHLLLSGDNSRAGYDEPTSMRRRALDAGVPAEAITLDFAGFSTHDSCTRARRIFGVEAAVVITQDFHVTRAVSTCRAEGIDAVGLALRTGHYAAVDVRALVVRDRLATLKAFVEVHTSARPRFLGSFVGLSGSVALPEVNAAWDERLRAARGGR